MIGPSKILTVSYGTFSCTLEGFDDPFTTMRAIAEYFRDLAAEDRYFGATPPTPDAEMLHRIAEREVQRRVEARVGDHGIVLRAGGEPGGEPVAAPVAEPVILPQTETSAAALATAAVAAPVAAAAETPPEARVAEPEPAFEDVEEESADRPEAVFAEDMTFAGEPGAAPALSSSESGSEAADHDSSDVAAKLSRIRAVIAAAQAAKAAPAPAAPAAAVVIEPEAAFEDEEEALATGPAAAAFDDEVDTGDFAATVTVDDDFGFDLELDELPATRHAEPVAEAVAEPVAEPVAEAVAPGPVAGVDEVALAATPGEAEPEPAPAEIAAVPVADGVAEEWVAAEEMIDDEDYAALAVAMLTGAEPADEPDHAIGAEAATEEDAPAQDRSLDALDLSGWRIEETATEDETVDEAFDAVAAEEPAATIEDIGDTGGATEDDAEAATAGRRPGFFERARARVAGIRLGAAPAEETHTAEAHAPEEAAGEEEDYRAEAAPAAEPVATEADADEDDHAAIFAALNAADEDGMGDAGSDEDWAAFDDDLAGAAAEAEEADAEADEAGEAAILAGIGAAIGAQDETQDETQDAAQDGEDDTFADDLSAIAHESRRDAHEGRAILEDHAGDGEASVERLMEEAKSKLEGVESRRRFSAIAHLKAAVAATVADRKLKSQDVTSDEGASAAEDIDRYRDDLSKAVRPRRPTTEGAAVTRRPALSDRPAPLVLVSEQRVDIDEDAVAPSALVRPRRIGAAALTLAEADDDLADEEPLSPEEARNFAEFADRLGAASLAELLEAAAAYTATVEGLPHFSRPHILKKVSGYAEEDEFTREDELRSFGMLLRQGKIQKISRGQFTITEASRFMSEARRVAR